jgi:hypothetical protein
VNVHANVNTVVFVNMPMPNQTAWSKRNRLIRPPLVKRQIVENRALGAFQAFGRAGSFDRH